MVLTYKRENLRYDKIEQLAKTLQTKIELHDVTSSISREELHGISDEDLEYEELDMGDDIEYSTEYLGGSELVEVI
jgi:hypothetical protein